MNIKAGIRAGAHVAATKVGSDSAAAARPIVGAAVAGAKDSFVRLASEGSLAAGAAAALPDLPPTGNAVVPDTIRAGGALAGGTALEEMRAFRVGDRLAGMFLGGLLPIGSAEGDGGSSEGTELSEQERQRMLARALEVPPEGATKPSGDDGD